MDQFTLGLTVLFFGVAVLAGLAASIVLTRSSAERRRIREMAAAASSGLIGLRTLTLTDRPDDMAKRVSSIVPKSLKEMNRLQKRMVKAGIRHPGAAVYFAAAEIICPIPLALMTIGYMGVAQGGILALLAAGVGYALPGVWLAWKTSKRQKEIQNGLPDALDLL